jgi:hypothetical protein
MIISVGFVCVDGIVLVADTEYTSVRSKYGGEKLLNIEGRLGHAGRWRRYNGHRQDGVDAFRHDPDEVGGLASLRTKIIDIAGHFYAEHILPMQGTNELRQLLLLVAIEIRNRENLL